MEELSGVDPGNADWESDCDDEEEVGLISKLALGVDATEIGNYDGKSTPINGSQYLLSVIMEAKKSPKVVVADMKAIESTSANISVINSQTEDSFDENKLDPVFLPTPDWQTQIITTFSELRSKIDCKRSLVELGRVKFDHPQMPEKGNVVLWFKYCFGTEVTNAITNKSKKSSQNPQADLNTIPEDFFVDLSKDNCHELPVDVEIKEENEVSDDEPLKNDVATNVGSRPLMRIMLCLSQRLVEFLIACHLVWLKKYGLLNVRQGEWIYALLTCVQKPLEPSTVSDIRSICKLCISLRSKFCDFKSENEKIVGPSQVSLSDKELEYLNTLNLFICIISNYFGQSDLIS